MGDIVDNVILSEGTGPYTSLDSVAFLLEKLRSAFTLTSDDTLSGYVVGSAKLGFSFLEKPARDGRSYKPAYRAYEPGVSDIDIAVVSPVLYGRLWQDLARHGARKEYFPWHNGMAPHMFYGWIRPDKFPESPPQRCTDWMQAISETQRSTHFRFTKLRCAIYQSRFFLKLYQQRGVLAAQRAEY